MAFEPDDGDCWVFHMDDNGRWRWNRQSPTGERVMASFTTFETFYDCVKDARRHGYDGSLEMPSESDNANSNSNA